MVEVLRKYLDFVYPIDRFTDDIKHFWQRQLTLLEASVLFSIGYFREHGLVVVNRGPSCELLPKHNRKKCVNGINIAFFVLSFVGWLTDHNKESRKNEIFVVTFLSQYLWR